jgi:nitronate monooxygenase
VSTDPVASPTSFPFKVARLEGTNSEEETYLARRRVCDLGFLRESYRTPDGTIDFRCAAEPVATYVAKGGKSENTLGKKCLCNALLADIGYPQVRCGKYIEKGLVTSGDGLVEINRFFPRTGTSYTAKDVLAKLLNG